jgi:hypothetical protein
MALLLTEDRPRSRVSGVGRAHAGNTGLNTFPTLGVKTMPRVASLAFALFFALAAVPAQAASPVRTTTDLGADIPCIFQESQAWWQPLPGHPAPVEDFGHLHIGACMPWGQAISGQIWMEVRLILHDNPGKFDYFNPVYKTNSREYSTAKNYSLQGWTCPSGTCEKIVKIPIYAANWDKGGLNELRIRAYVKEPDGGIMHSSVNVFPLVQNGKTRSDMTRKRYPRGKGWYTGTGYCEANILQFPPVHPTASWVPSVQAIRHGAAEDRGVSRHVVALDANAHAGIPGTVLKQGTGELPATPINLAGLEPGPHRLSIRAECDAADLGAVNSGVQVFWFDVP